MLNKSLKVIFLISALSIMLGCSSHKGKNLDDLKAADILFDRSGFELDDEDRKIIPQIVVIASDTITIELDEDFEKSIYIYVKNNTKESFDFKQNLETKFKDLGFEIVQKPSMAEYIMLLDIMEIGQANVESITKAVLDSDNAEFDLEGRGAHFLIFDLALVLRAHPKGDKPNNAVIRLSSMRSVKEHNKLRMALVYKSEKQAKNSVFEYVIVSEVIALMEKKGK